MFERAEIDFTYLEEISLEGRNSRVFKAIDHQLDASIVVKRIDRSRFPDEYEYFAEAKRLYDARHPHIVPVKFACKTDEHIFIAMPEYERGSVHSFLLKRHPTVREIIQIGLDFLTGLHHAHLRGLVHFDIKPSNILIDASGKAALADFGLARYIDDTGLAKRDVMYHSHRPPEGFLYDQVGQVGDIYQAGLTLYRMAVGLGSFEKQWMVYGGDLMDTAKQVIEGRLPDRRTGVYPAHIPTQLCNLIRKALRPDPDERYQEVLGIINDLGKIDKWLDWQYRCAGAVERWSAKSDVHKKIIGLTHRSDGRYEVRAKTIRTADGHERNRTALSGNADTRTSANRIVRNALTKL